MNQSNFGETCTCPNGPYPGHRTGCPLAGDFPLSDKDLIAHCVTELKGISTKGMNGVDVITLGRVENILSDIIDPGDPDCSCGDMAFPRMHWQKDCGYNP